MWECHVSCTFGTYWWGFPRKTQLISVCLCVRYVLVRKPEKAQLIQPPMTIMGSTLVRLPLHHVCHHRRVRHGVPHGRLPLLRVREVTAVLIVEEILPHQIRLWKEKQSAYSIYSGAVTSSFPCPKGQKMQQHLCFTTILLGSHLSSTGKIYLGVYITYTGPLLQPVKRCKRHCSLQVGAHCNQLFNTAVNYFDAKKSARCSRVLAVTELVLSRASVLIISILSFGFDLHWR